jgi:hypothetical protein
MRERERERDRQTELSRYERGGMKRDDTHILDNDDEKFSWMMMMMMKYLPGYSMRSCSAGYAEYGAMSTA